MLGKNVVVGALKYAAKTKNPVIRHMREILERG